MEWLRRHRHKHRRQRDFVYPRFRDKARKVKLLRAPACHAYAYMKAFYEGVPTHRLMQFIRASRVPHPQQPVKTVHYFIRQWHAEWLKQCLFHGPKWCNSAVITAARKEVADAEAQFSVF